jgi:transposase
MGEFGLVVPQGAARVKQLITLVADPGTLVPEAARPALQVLVSALERLEDEIRSLEAEIVRRARENETARRLMTMPGVGPLIATALVALAPPPQTFRRGRDFAAWLGLTPWQHSTGGKQRLGATTKMGERSLRRLLIIGANSVVIKRHAHAAAKPGTWLGSLLTRKPPMLVRVALANKMARIVWALMFKGEACRAPAVTA